jgi:hypothetical protein
LVQQKHRIRDWFRRCLEATLSLLKRTYGMQYTYLSLLRTLRLPKEKRAQDWLTVYYADVEAEKQLYHPGRRNRRSHRWKTGLRQSAHVQLTNDAAHQKIRSR